MAEPSGVFDMAGKLLKSIGDVVGTPWGFEINNELEKLKRTLYAVSSVLFDAEERSKTDGSIENWLIDINLVFHDIEDLLCDLSIETLKRQVMAKNKVNIFVSCSNQVVFRLNMGPQVKLVRKRLESIASYVNVLNFTRRSEEETMNLIIRRNRNREGGSVPSKIIVGRDEDKKRIIQLMFDDSNDVVSVISIVGVAGLGKTTLAELVYTTKEVKEHFDLMAWVHVTDIFNIKLIWERIILSGAMMNCEGLETNRLKDKLKNVIGGRKFLLVLDDVWNENRTIWMELEESLLGGAKGSKILVTSRFQSVAHSPMSNRIYLLQGLSQEMSMKLFAHFAFRGGGGGFPKISFILRIAEEAVETCAGNPFLIKTIGCMLGLKTTEYSNPERREIQNEKREKFLINWKMKNNTELIYLCAILHISPPR